MCPVPLFGRARIEPLANGTYRPADEGEWAVVVAVHDRHNELVDLVAFFPDDPTRWWLRYGDDCPVLGCGDLATAAYFGDPITLYSAPEAYLFAHARPARGWIACVLDWSVDLGPLFDGVRRVEIGGLDLAHRFLKAVRRGEPVVKGVTQTPTSELYHAT